MQFVQSVQLFFAEDILTNKFLWQERASQGLKPWPRFGWQDIDFKQKAANFSGYACMK